MSEKGLGDMACMDVLRLTRGELGDVEAAVDRFTVIAVSFRDDDRSGGWV